MEIRARGGVYYWRDLGSTNGTIVNERVQPEGRLNHGDHIRVGNTTLIFEQDEGPPKMTPSTYPTAPIETPEQDVSTAKIDVRENELLKAVYSVMNDVATNYDPCSLVDNILETTMRAIGAQRGAVLFAGGEADVLKPCPICSEVHVIKDGQLSRSDVAKIRISNTVARRVLDGGESILFQDTDINDDLAQASSILALKLRSIICVPLKGKLGTLGILYIDSDRPKQQYTQDHMLLSTAVGNTAGLAIENAQMHQQILDRQRMNQEIEFAGIIQDGFLFKKWPEPSPQFDVFGDTRPAKTVGGDFYDFIRLGQDRLGILIADVSGKGVPAALAMAQLLAEFRVRAMQELNPGAVLAALNETMAERSQRGMFCTMCYLTVDLASGRVTCANAGHHPVLRIRGKDIQEFSDASGPPVGILPGVVWRDQETTLARGEALLMYTDGIVEARGTVSRGLLKRSESIAEYGVESLRELLSRHHGATARAMVGAVIEDVNRHTRPGAPHDDCTLIALRYSG